MKKEYLNPEIMLVDVTPLEMISESGGNEEPSTGNGEAPELPDDELY